MDDLQMLTTLLAKPGPSEDVVDRSRRRLRDRTRGPVRRRRVGLPVAGLGLAAVTAAAVAVTASVTTTSTATPDDPPAAARPSARQVLLVAATTAENRPAGTGAYWHVTTVSTGGNGERQRQESWTRRDGRTWVRLEKTQGQVVRVSQRSPFRMAGVGLSVERLQRLPTDPAALKAWITDTVEHGDARTSAGRPPAGERDERILVSLTSLVSQLPVPPKVRAAAFRAIAGLPDVRSLGAVEGGQGLLISLGGRQARLVVDPATSQVRNTNFFVTADGAETWLPSHRSATVTTEWTDRLPG